MTHTKEELMEKYKKLPQDVQDAIFSEETAEILQKIGKENKLDIEKIGILADETGLLMLGITAPKNFVEQLAGRLGIEKESVRKIAKEVNERVFSKIRESLKEIHGLEQDSKRATQTAEVEPLPQARNSVRTKSEDAKIETKIPPVIKPRPQPEPQPEPPKPSTIEVEPLPQAQHEVRPPDEKEEPATPGVAEVAESEIFRSKPEVRIDPYREPIE